MLFSFLLPHPAGSKAASWVGPKIVLDHVHVYIYNNYKALVHTQPSIVLLPNIHISFRFTDCKSEETSKICQFII